MTWGRMGIDVDIKQDKFEGSNHFLKTCFVKLNISRALVLPPEPSLVT